MKKDSIVWDCRADCGGFNLGCETLGRHTSGLFATSHGLGDFQNEKLAYAFAIDRSKTPERVEDDRSSPPDREHGWQHVDRTAEAGDSKSIRIAGDLEYIRVRVDRYFHGDAMFGHKSSSQWIKLIPRDFPPLEGFFELRLHMSNPRTIGYSFDSIETSFWSNYHGIHMQPE